MDNTSRNWTDADGAIAPETNSQAYWDQRFRTDWVSSRGADQSRYFARLALERLPAWFIQAVRTQHLTVCDWGCAEGDGTDVLAGSFGSERVSGVDFSAPAIDAATQRYPHLRFRVEDWLTQIAQTTQAAPAVTYDIVFSSNTLEHFREPRPVLACLLAHARKGVVLLLPYREFERHTEHCHTFVASNLAFAPSPDYVLAHAAVIDASDIDTALWPGHQILLIYARTAFMAEIGAALADVDIHDERQVAIADRLADAERTVRERDLYIAGLVQTIRTRDTQLAEYGRRIGTLDRTQAKHLSEIAGLRQKIDKRRSQATRLRQTIAMRDYEIQRLATDLLSIRESRGWRYLTALHLVRLRMLPPGSLRYRIVQKIGSGMRLARRATHSITPANLTRFTHHARHDGLGAAIRRTRAYLTRVTGFQAAQPLRRYDIRQRGHADELLAYLHNESYTGVFVMGSCCMGWHEVFKQRHHHIADHLMASGFLIICAMNPIYPDDYTECLRRDAPGRFLVNFDDRDVWAQAIDLLAVESKAPLFYHLVGTEPGTTMNDIAALKRRGYTFVYDYIDEVSREINPAAPEFCLARHEVLLRDESILIIASADNLHAKAGRHRNSNLICVPNGVRLEDWHVEPDAPIPDEIARIVCEGKPIVGYYGSFAAWMDYTLITALSRARPDVNIVMIGYDYEWGKGAFTQSRIAELSNVHIVPAQKYERLKYFSRFFDAGIIPFRTYELTKSVSPVKLFEYMAQGIPVVAAGLPECRKYASCLNADDAEDFVAKVGQALSLKHDADYQARLRSDAQANTWTARGRIIEAEMQRMSARAPGKLLTIVVPTYNMATLLPRCLDSMLPPSQCDRLDIIVVVDGSTDNSLDVANDYAHQYPGTIRVVTKTNGGHGSCINVGIQQAAGQYFKVVDADDWLDPLALTLHMHGLARTTVDVMVTNYLRVHDGQAEGGQLMSYADRLQEKTYPIEAFYRALMTDHSCLSYAHMHAITYRTDVLRQANLRITEHAFYVDQEYISLPQPHVSSAAFEDIALYRYNVGRPGQSVAPDVARRRAPDNHRILMNVVALLESLPDGSPRRAYIQNIAFHQSWFYLTHSDDAQARQDLLQWWRHQSRALSKALQRHFRVM